MKKKISCAIIDDEPPASEIIKCYINKTADFEVAEIYSDPIKAFEELPRRKVDVVFCDVEMPDINGLQLLESLSLNKDALIVIVSAHAKYAIDGFNIDAIDYLLKPVSFARFLKTTQKIRQHLANKNTTIEDTNQKPVSNATAPQDYIFIKSNSKLLKINYNEILYIESLGDYIKLHIENATKSMLILDSLKHMEELLPPNIFKRIHRSYIVNVLKIKAIEYKKAIIGKDLSLPISNSYYDHLYESLIANNIIR